MKLATMTKAEAIQAYVAYHEAHMAWQQGGRFSEKDREKRDLALDIARTKMDEAARQPWF